jgi:plasmid stabilization system protein ParE
MKTYTYKVTDEAESDAKEIYEWYENQLQGLGERFLSHLEKSFNKIAISPLAFANTGFLGFRRFVFSVFPYKYFIF